MPQSLTSRSSSTRQFSENFYEPLIEHLSIRDIAPFIGTVGANLTQNCYFLIESSHAVCHGQATCASTLSIIACAIDIIASGTQNTFQRFWTSLTWAWVTRLPCSIATFIRALRAFLENNKEQIENSAIYIYMPQPTYDKINTPEFEKVIEITSAYYKLSPRLPPELPSDLSPIQICYYAEDTQDNDRHLCYCYNSKNLPLDPPGDKGFLTLKNPTYCSPEGFFKFILLVGPPWTMFIFQTITMLSTIFSRIFPNSLIANIFACFLGAFFGHGKYKVNNTMRRKTANKHWEALKKPAFYVTSLSYFSHTIAEVFFGIFLLLCTEFHAGLKKLGASSLRLFGFLVGIGIALFYLNVGLFTKDGIQFTIKTLMQVVGTKNELFLDFYIKARPYVDAACVISSLSFNAFLTQMPESIKKCDDLAKKFEHWMDSPPRNTDEDTETNGSEESTTPLFVHVCNVIDIAVFGLSANHAIGDLFQRLSADGMPEWTQSIGDALLRYHAETVFAFCAAISNLIFTYVTAAPDQRKAWNMLFNRLRGLRDDTPETREESFLSTIFSRTSSMSQNAFSLTDALIPPDQERSEQDDDEEKKTENNDLRLVLS